jgi:hypothetical protein
MTAVGGYAEAVDDLIAEIGQSLTLLANQIEKNL